MCRRTLFPHILFLTLLIGCKSGSSGSRPPSDPPPPPPAELAATPGWKLDLEQFSLVSLLGADWAHLVAFSGNQTQYRPVDQLMVATGDGAVRWKKRRTMKVYGENAPWSVRVAAPDTKTILYETRYKAMFHISVADGSSDRALGNVLHFAPCGDRLFVGAAKPYLWSPADRKVHELTGLTPVFEELGVETAPGFPATALDADRVAFRSQDGALRVVSCSQGKELWRYADPLDRKNWSVDLPVSRGVVLVSTLMPPFLPRTLVHGLNEAGPVMLPGSLQAQVPATFTDGIATFLTTEGLNLVTLSGVAIATGEISWQVELPIVPCTRTKSFHVCRNGKNLFAIELVTGKKTLDQELAVAPRFISALDDHVVAVGPDRFTVLDMRQNAVIWSGPIEIKTAPVELVQVALARPDRVALVLRTVWPDRPHLERLYLHSFSPAEPDKAPVQKQLGKPYEMKAPSRVGDGERDLIFPAWLHEGRLYTAVDGLFQVVDPARGTTSDAFTLPGKGPVSLRRVRPDGAALLERGDQLMLVKPRGGIAWNAPLKGREVRLVTSETVITVGANDVAVWSINDGKPLGPGAAGLKGIPAIRGADAGRVFFHVPDGHHVLENGEVKKVREFPMHSAHPGDRDWLLYSKNEAPPGKGAWAALSLDTGKVLWRKVVTKAPELVGGAKELGELEPKEASFHPASWVRASAEGFWIPDPSHRCLYLIRPEDGQVEWVRCAQRLGGPPAFTADGQWMLLPAAGPWHEPGQPVPEGAPIEKTLSLVALHLRDRHTRVLYTPPENHSVALPIAPVAGPQLLITVYEEKFKNQKCFLQSLTLGAPPAPPRTAP